MTKVSIISLIYRSANMADWVYESARKFTPMLERGEAEFLFVANDPTPGLLRHLRDRGYPHIVNRNRVYSDEDMFAAGYATPEYMSRVYRGYNEGIRHAAGDYVVLVNSDNYFSPDWLENLLKYSDRTRVITSELVEPQHHTHALFPGAVHGEFGSDPGDFDEDGFLLFADRLRKTGLHQGGAYMPTLFHRDVAIEAGLYPDGNVAGASFDEVARYGDEAFFDALEAMGVEHFTAMDSIVYHLKEGEKDDVTGEEAGLPVEESPDTLTPLVPYPPVRSVLRVIEPLEPTKRHMELMNAIAGRPPVAKPLLSSKTKSRIATRLERMGLLGATRWVLRLMRRVRAALTGSPGAASR